MSKTSLLPRILKSIFFQRASMRAVRYARNRRSLMGLVREATSKSGGFSGKTFANFREQVALLSRMLRAVAAGEYRDIPWKSLIRTIAVLIYFVSPIDIIPDFLPLIGITDDIVLVTWLFSGIGSDLEKFRAWENSRGTIKID